MEREIWRGQEYPLGAHYDGVGTNFAIYSENAQRIELCLFDHEDDRKERERVVLPEQTSYTFHVYLPNIKPGQLYGYRIYGPYDPARGLRFNPNKVLCDPYAKAIANEVNWEAAMHPYRLGDPAADLAFDETDNAWGAPKAVVIDNVFDWKNDHNPRTPWRRTIIYETHVKGLTALHPLIPLEQRGTYAGLASEPVIEYLQRLGVTAIELLPIHEIVDESPLINRGLKNYWGYNTLSYFAPSGRYSHRGRRGEQVAEFKQMVKVLHRAGIEVILDVVYNHTGEGNHLGPMLSLKGIDNPTYFRTVPGSARYYMDYTGCGNSLNMRHPQTLKLIMDSLRYWVTEMHVDGFRFDLASALARELHDVDKLSAFFDIIHQDPILSTIKLIAEPWDVGEGGYQVGNFPVLWTEWNGRYRDAIRRFWKGDAAITAEFGFRLTGSSDLYEVGGRRPHASINFVTAHDGFTMKDLVSYNQKHNEGNHEDNRDGTDQNDSWNHGVEGETDDPQIRELRDRQVRNLFTTLLLSHGVPMISGGDEIGRSQRGNNNTYCQDNELSWHSWELDDSQRELLGFVRRLIALRHEEPVLHRRKFFSGGYSRDSQLRDIAWFRPDGAEMGTEDWLNPFSRSFGMLLGGDAIRSLDKYGRKVEGNTLLILMNAHYDTLEFVLPSIEWGERWEVLIDTRTAAPPEVRVQSQASDRYTLLARSVAVLRLYPPRHKILP